MTNTPAPIVWRTGDLDTIMRDVIHPHYSKEFLQVHDVDSANALMLRTIQDKRTIAQTNKASVDACNKLLVERAKNKRQEDQSQAEADWIARRRGRKDDAPCVLLLSPEDFSDWNFAEKGYRYRHELAWEFLRAVYLAADHKLGREKLKSIVAKVNGKVQARIQQQQGNETGSGLLPTPSPDDSLFEAVNVFMSDDKDKQVYSAALGANLVFSIMYDRELMPVNPIAVTIVCKQEIYSRYQAKKLPRDVAQLVEAWTVHVSKIDHGVYAPAMEVLTNPLATVDEVFMLQETHNFDEVHAMLLAFQRVLMSVVDMTNSPIAGIPLSEFFNKLTQVDKLAKYMKLNHFRARTSSINLAATPDEFHATGLYLANCVEYLSNVTVENFIKSLKTTPVVSNKPMMSTGRVAAVANPTPGPNRPQNSATATTAKGRICNYCGGATLQHKGSNCPFRAKVQQGTTTKAEVRKLPAAEKDLPAVN